MRAASVRERQIDTREQSSMQRDYADNTITVLTVHGHPMDDIQIPLSSPDVTDAEIQAVVDVMRTRHLSLGPKIPEFEDSFRQYLGVDEAVVVSSGTAALHCCL